MTDTTLPLPLTLERIAFRSTRGEGAFAKPQWTEVAIYYRHDATAGTPRYMAEVKGCSSNPAHLTRMQQHNTMTLGLAIDALRDDRQQLSTPCRIVRDQALTWQERRSRSYSGSSRTPVVRTYTDAQHAAAAKVISDAADRHACPHCYGIEAMEQEALLDAVAAALGLTREVARG